jgi:hypothetical protein
MSTHSAAPAVILQRKNGLGRSKRDLARERLEIEICMRRAERELSPVQRAAAA